MTLFQLSSKKGLTITELLVAIALIAITAALLVPVVGKGRALAAANGCVNNLRQMYTAYAQFVNDNSNFLPTYREFSKDSDGAEVRGPTWSAHLLPYFGDSSRPPNRCRCPGERDPKVGTTYAMNAFFTGSLTPLSDPPPERMVNVSAPSRRFLITDSSGVIRITAGKFAQEASFRHPGEQVNVLFLDGHIEPRALGSIPIPANGYPTTSSEYRAFWRGTP